MAIPEELDALDSQLEENPSVCGAIVDDVPCLQAPAWQSTASCCGWTDEACAEHRRVIDDAFARHAPVTCGTCGEHVELEWRAL